MDIPLTRIFKFVEALLRQQGLAVMYSICGSGVRFQLRFADCQI